MTQESIAVGRGPDVSSAFTRRSGAVSAFDTKAGLGRIVDAEGQEWSFHVTSIADGSRRTTVDAEVTFLAGLGPVGLEALEIAPVAVA